MASHHLTTSIDIAAPPERVWSILVDLDRYTAWNPFIRSASGAVTVGARLAVRLHPPGGRPMTFRPTVTTAEPPRRFEWLGHLVVPGLFDGRHRFDLEPSATGTRLTQSEDFTGLLVPVLRRALDGPTRAGFEAMNAALKARAETTGGTD